MLIIKEKTETITSLELLEQINYFRKQEGEKTKLRHADLLNIIRDEFEEEIGERKISLTSYKDKWNRKQPMYILTFFQATQVLNRESKTVRKALFKYIEELEENIKQLKIEKNNQLLLENKNIKKENERLKFELGNGENLKAIQNVDWLREYFNFENKNTMWSITKKLIMLSNEKQITYDVITNNVFLGEIYVFHTVIYSMFKKMLDEDEDWEILRRYRIR